VTEKCNNFTSKF